MMEYPVIHNGKEIGSCQLSEQGLYWSLECDCLLFSDNVERIYSGTRRIGVLEREGNRLRCRRRLSKASTPELPPVSGMFTLAPVEPYRPWQGSILGKELSGFRDGDMLLFPYHPDEPCPCEALICFFEVRDNFWRLPVNEEWLQTKTDA